MDALKGGGGSDRGRAIEAVNAALGGKGRVCDILVIPEKAWLMQNGNCGVKLTATHVLLH